MVWDIVVGLTALVAIVVVVLIATGAGD